MTRLRRIQSIVGLAQADERAAAAQLVKSHQEVHEVEKKLQELKVYRQEYAQWQAQEGISLGATQMQSLWVFIRRLDEAIAQLETQLETQLKIGERDQRRWLETHNKARILNDIADRHRRREAWAQVTREQREVDDRVPIGSKALDP